MKDTVAEPKAALNIIAQIMLSYVQILAVNPARVPEVSKGLLALAEELKKLAKE